MITIVDYGVGNPASIANMLRRIGVDTEITGDHPRIARASKLILPGVGAFDPGMENLEKRGLAELLRTRVLSDGVPILGICLGAQLLTGSSEEGTRQGLGFFRARTVRFRTDDLAGLKIPHMGWTDVRPAGGSRLFAPAVETPRFYFVHSYHFEPGDPADVGAWSNYGYDFPSVLERGNLLAVQFHPEKSHRFGKELLKNFAERY